MLEAPITGYASTAAVGVQQIVSGIGLSKPHGSVFQCQLLLKMGALYVVTQVTPSTSPSTSPRSAHTREDALRGW